MFSLGANVLAALVVGVAGAAPPAVAQTAEVRIDAALQNITHIVRTGRVGYATFWDGNKFVQCRRLPEHTLRCEAAGSTMQSSLKNVLTNDRLAVIFKLGWAFDPSFGNYVRVFPLGTSTSTAAEHIVNLLKDGYGAERDAIAVATHWVADTPCPPRAGPSQNLAGSVNGAASMERVVIRACFYKPDTDPPQLVNSAEELIALYGAMAAAEIQRLRVNAANQQVFTIFKAGIGYLQCRPEDKSIYCEAQSAESWPALTTILTADRISWLHDTGYADPGRAPNYWKEYPLDKYDDAAIATELLTVLYTAYGYKGATRLGIKTEE
jgi:hypothetical protein